MLPSIERFFVTFVGVENALRSVIQEEYCLLNKKVENAQQNFERCEKMFAELTFTKIIDVSNLVFANM